MQKTFIPCVTPNQPEPYEHCSDRGFPKAKCDDPVPMVGRPHSRSSHPSCSQKYAHAPTVKEFQNLPPSPSPSHCPDYNSMMMPGHDKTSWNTRHLIFSNSPVRA